jgi:hypothetical protein
MFVTRRLPRRSRQAGARITVSAAIDRYFADSTNDSAKNGKGPPRERIRRLNVDVHTALGQTKLEEVADDDLMVIIAAVEEEGLEHKPSKLFARAASP